MRLLLFAAVKLVNNLQLKSINYQLIEIRGNLATWRSVNGSLGPRPGPAGTFFLSTPIAMKSTATPPIFSAIVD